MTVGQNGASTNLPGGARRVRGLGRETRELRDAILIALDESDPPVTVRQMFYLLSTAGAVEKTEAGYRRAQRQILHMRREGLIEYWHIADSTRWMRKPQTYAGLEDCLRQAADQYRQWVWRDADTYVEIWCEKDALASVFCRETERYDVPLMVTRGYSSESFAWEAAGTINSYLNEGRRAVIYYFGDFDPSGWQMSQDLERKLRGFVSRGRYPFFQFERVAVTPHQAEEWGLPSRPSKRTDTRHKAFEREFGAGTESIELDAIPPAALRGLVQGVIERHLPPQLLDAVAVEEKAAREALAEMAGVLS